MGYDSFVRCNCLKLGKTKPYPFDYSFHFDEEDFLKIDEGSNILNRADIRSYF